MPTLSLEQYLDQKFSYSQKIGNFYIVGTNESAISEDNDRTYTGKEVFDAAVKYASSFLDQNEDGIIDSPALLESLEKNFVFTIGHSTTLVPIEDTISETYNLYASSMKTDIWPYLPSFNGKDYEAPSALNTSMWRPEPFNALWEEVIHVITDAYNRYNADWSYEKGSQLSNWMQADLDANAYEYAIQNAEENGEYTWDTAVSEYIHQVWQLNYAGHTSILTDPQKSVLEFIKAQGVPMTLNTTYSTIPVLQTSTTDTSGTDTTDSTGTTDSTDTADPIDSSTDNDTFVVQPGSAANVAGGDVYALSTALFNSSIQSSDTQGSNGSQTVLRLELSGSQVANATPLNLTNGVQLTVLNASSYQHRVGEDPLSGMDSVGFFSMEGVTTSSSSNLVTPSADNTATATDGIEETISFSSSNLSEGHYTVDGFNSSEDTLKLAGLSGASGSVLSDLHGDSISFGVVGVQVNQITQSVFVSLGLDGNGEVISIELNGVSDPSLVNIDLA